MCCLGCIYLLSVPDILCASACATYCPGAICLLVLFSLPCTCFVPLGVCHVLLWLPLPSLCPRHPVCICMCYRLTICHILTCALQAAIHMFVPFCICHVLPWVLLPSFSPRHPVCICMCYLLPRCHMLTCVVFSAIHMFSSMGHAPCVALCVFTFFLSQASCVCICLGCVHFCFCPGHLSGVHLHVDLHALLLSAALCC